MVERHPPIGQMLLADGHHGRGRIEQQQRDDAVPEAAMGNGGERRAPQLCHPARRLDRGAIADAGVEPVAGLAKRGRPADIGEHPGQSRLQIVVGRTAAEGLPVPEDVAEHHQPRGALEPDREEILVVLDRPHPHPFERSPDRGHERFPGILLAEDCHG